jgi:hypothetical protein
VQKLGSSYRIRSATGHQGRLHGSETTFGITDLSLFRVSPATAFELLGVTAICEASRHVIAQVMREALGIPRLERR